MKNTTAKTYSEKLKDPRWQKKRLKIFERDGFKCPYCNDETTTLHVHHEKYEGEPWEIDDEFLKTACEVCHAIIEDFKLLKVKREVVRVRKCKEIDGMFSYAMALTNNKTIGLYGKVNDKIQLIGAFDLNELTDIVKDFNG